MNCACMLAARFGSVCDVRDSFLTIAPSCLAGRGWFRSAAALLSKVDAGTAHGASFGGWWCTQDPGQEGGEDTGERDGEYFLDIGKL